MNGVPYDITCNAWSLGDALWVELRMAYDMALSTERRLAHDNDDDEHSKLYRYELEQT